MTPEIAEQSLWPYKSVNVNGLFGHRSVPLLLDPALTVITGENGSGKSTILQAVDALSNGRWVRFHSLPLTSLEIVFADESRLMATNTEDGVAVTGPGEPWEIDLHVLDSPDAQRRRALIRRDIERGRMSARTAARLEKGLDFPDIADIELPDWLVAVLDQTHTKLISARRLEHRLRSEPGVEPGRTTESVVDRYASEMRDRMQYELSRYAAESQQQEKSLPSRIVHAMQEGTDEDSEAIAVEVDGLRAEVRELADLLARVGLFDEEEDPDQQFEGYPRDNENILLAVREVYRVARDRLDRLTRLRSDLDLFATFLNQRLTGKRVELNQEKGIDVVLPETGRIRPSQLSSGEQQLLALAYELLFGTSPRAVVLLDEPELSLHVGWLNGLISAFLDFGQRRELQYVVATHSPSIVAGFSERERSLDLLKRWGCLTMLRRAIASPSSVLS
jgi:energy-coupling factor transporter ATP-binding protein EcfA2